MNKPIRVHIEKDGLEGALDRTTFSVMAIILLFIIGFFLFFNPGGNKLVGILMIGLGIFLIYKRKQRHKK